MFRIALCDDNLEFLKGLKKLSLLHKNSKALLESSKRNIFHNGKNRKYFAYEFISRNQVYTREEWYKT